MTQWRAAVLEHVDHFIFALIIGLTEVQIMGSTSLKVNISLLKSFFLEQ